MTDPQRPQDAEAVRPLPDITIEPVDLPGTGAPEPTPARRRDGAAAVPTRVEPASPDVVLPLDDAAVPGAHRGGFTRPPTAPVDVLELHPAELGPAPWEPETPETPLRARESTGVGGYALALAAIALAASLVVGWVFPLGVAALALATVAVRRRVQRVLAGWAIALAAASLVYSAGWLLFAARQAGWIG
ncbi:hypothetical protein [Microbacterium sp. SORGH_AS_0888]|uniref:hypothetical protein n=1 Tax=Microbacterium sp. SORGH_AS_0888 TaxID=3041791 RepID=UPI00278B7EA4|nr:hypothetical protein [Microbacterium sp. SORGH_AS_0888]MDQ1129242.1 hypothetical protein [Microbacterium sp. SORGH_AS_0888]